MRTLTVELREVAVDGLPDMDAVLGRVGILWDGEIVSGWPISAEYGGIREGVQLWEPAEDRFGGSLSGVTHYVVFPVSFWDMSHD